jgi:hypothetical protein
MLAIAKINHNELDGVRVTLSIDKLNLYADGVRIETPTFANLKEVDEYVGTTWASPEWDLEWLVEDLVDMDKPVRLTLRIPGMLYEKVWQIHARTKKSLNQIIVEILEKEFE